MKLSLAVLCVIVLAVGVGIFAAGCGAKNVKGPVPASQPVNTFEEYAYKVLDDAQAGLLDTDRRLKSGELPQSTIADYDRAAVLYNTSIELLKRYDSIYRAGNDVTAIQTEISQDLAQLISLGLQLWPKK